MKYYGLVDIENLSYGFVEENDNRITDKFIEITDEYHQQLLDEQGQGLVIVSDNKTVFTAKPNLYFVNEQGLWERKTDEDYEAEQELKERERIAMLSLTRGDVFRGLLQAKGVTRLQLRAMIETNPQLTEVQKEMALIDFDEALNFYRGNTLIDTVGLALGITPYQLDKFFEYNDYTYLQ